ELDHRLGASIQHKLLLDRTYLTGLIPQMASLNPVAVLERGYAILTNQAGKTISRVGQVSGGESLNVKVSDGVFGVHVDEE
ncbi:MAG TPA: exodeoxyribonuclease VII large subunit, partial [bacterium]